MIKLKIVRWSSERAWASSRSWRRAYLAQRLREVATLSQTDAKRLARNILDQEVTDIKLDKEIGKFDVESLRHILESLGADLVIEQP